jgi:hypothetical protein
MFILVITVVNSFEVQLNTTLMYDKRFETLTSGVISP